MTNCTAITTMGFFKLTLTAHFNATLTLDLAGPLYVFQTLLAVCVIACIATYGSLAFYQAFRLERLIRKPVPGPDTKLPSLLAYARAAGDRFYPCLLQHFVFWGVTSICCPGNTAPAFRSVLHAVFGVHGRILVQEACGIYALTGWLVVIVYFFHPDGRHFEAFEGPETALYRGQYNATLRLLGRFAAERWLALRAEDRAKYVARWSHAYTDDLPKFGTLGDDETLEYDWEDDAILVHTDEIRTFTVKEYEQRPRYYEITDSADSTPLKTPSPSRTHFGPENAK